MDEQLGIVLEPHRVICALHGEPFRAAWPDGYIPFLLHATDAVLGQEGFAAYAEGKVENINQMLDQRPLCCRMSPDDRLEAYAKSKIARPGFCRVCRNTASVVTIPLGAGGLPHSVCLLCLDKLEARPK